MEESTPETALKKTREQAPQRAQEIRPPTEHPKEQKRSGAVLNALFAEPLLVMLLRLALHQRLVLLLLDGDAALRSGRREGRSWGGGGVAVEGAW